MRMRKDFPECTPNHPEADMWQNEYYFCFWCALAGAAPARPRRVEGEEEGRRRAHVVVRQMRVPLGVSAVRSFRYLQGPGERQY